MYNLLKLQYINSFESLRCSECDHTATKKANIDSHFKAVHEKARDYKCTECNFTAARRNNLAKHIMLHHKTGNQQVGGHEEKSDDDGRWITTASGVKIQIHNVVEEVEAEDGDGVVDIVDAEDSGVWEEASDEEADLNDHICPECGFSFSTVENLMIHLQNVHWKKNEVATARTTTTSTGKILKAQGQAPSQIVDMTFKFKCDQCRYSSNSKANVIDHMRVVHGGIGRLSCGKCNYSTKSQTNLTEHMRMAHDGVSTSSIPLPLKNVYSKTNQGARVTTPSNSKANVNDHMRIVHEGIDRLKCDKCNYSTKSRVNLIEHSFVHAGVRNLRIPMKNVSKTSQGARVATSKETSYSKATVNDHKRIAHEGIDRLKCVKCNYSSNIVANLTQHMRMVHDEVRNLMMPSKNVHSKTTQGARVTTLKSKKINAARDFVASLGTTVTPKSTFNFKCNKCHYKSNKKLNLYDHIRSVHDGLKNFKCTMCAFQSHNKSHLSKHLVTVHVQKMDAINVSVVEPLPEKTRINIRKMVMSDPITWGSGSSDDYNQDGQDLFLGLKSLDHDNVENYVKKHYGVIDKIMQELNTPLRYLPQNPQEFIATEGPDINSYQALSSYCAEALSSNCAEGDKSTAESIKASPSTTCHNLDSGMNRSPSPTLQMDNVVDDVEVVDKIMQELSRMTRQSKPLEKDFTDNIKSCGDKDFAKTTESVAEEARNGEVSSPSGGDGAQPPPCPICNKFYPHHKKREHFATSHFQTELRRFITTSGGVTTCNICGKKGKDRATTARHCGLQHNKLVEVVSSEHIDYINRMKPGRKSTNCQFGVPRATSPTQSTRDGSMSPPATMIFI